MALFAYLAVSVTALFVLLLMLVLAVFLDDALLGILVLVVLTAFAGLWWLLARQHSYPTP